MKRILETAKLSLLIPVLFAAQAQAQVQEQQAVVHQTTSQLEVDLNEKTVICSHADYARPMLKVLIPGLADITLLDHQNSGAGAPCMTTGETCLGFDRGAKPNDILHNNPGKEKIEVTVTATRHEYIDQIEKTCTIQLLEHVETTIRGKKLFHDRSADIGVRNFEDCVKAVVP